MGIFEVLHMSFVHLHARSWYSFRRAASSPDALVEQAVQNGDEAIAITDYMSVAGCIPLQVAAKKAGIKAIIGAEVNLEGYPLVLLATSNTGYATINRLISRGFENKDEQVGFSDFADDHADVIVLTGGREGFVWQMVQQNQPYSSLEFVKRLSEVAPSQVFLEVVNHLRQGDSKMVGKLVALSKTARVPAVVTNDVRYATPNNAVRHEILVLSRHRLTVHDDHSERLWSGEAWLKPRSLLEQVVYGESLYANTLEIARMCVVDLLPERVLVPRAGLTDPNTELEALCRAGIKKRYPVHKRRAAVEMLERELEVIAELGLSEYFLVVHEVVAQAKQMGIRTAGRGSAASSIVVYSLGIAHADPMAFRLRFERFLNPGRFAGGREAPDIDVDVQSSRRQELIDWVTERFRGLSAMAANINVYGIRGAARDVARVLGWSHDQATQMTKVLPYHSRARKIELYKTELEQVVGQSVLLEVLVAATKLLDDCPRDLGLHSGGMLLARDSIYDHSAVKRSANGTLQAFLDKRTAEAAGLVKLDLLGLLALDVLETAVQLLLQQGVNLELEQVDLDDSRIYTGLQDGAVIGLFQIESPAQQALLAQLQPTCFLDLVAQVALIRPGPIQAQSVRPYIKRRSGLEKVSFLHPALEPVLKQTYGLMVFQDQAIETAQVMCGMDASEADKFRKLISKARDRDDMEKMRETFVQRSLETHGDLTLEIANLIFEAIAGFSGYGFPLAHSVAFAMTAAHTAYLKALHPAAFLCAVLQHEPGMYPRMTITEEAKRLGIPVLPVCLENSGVGFLLEGSAIRLPFSAVQGVSEETGRRIVLARPFSSLEDVYTRLEVPMDVLRGLAQAGVFDCFGSRREVLWELGVLEQKQPVAPAKMPQTRLFGLPTVGTEDLAMLEGLGVDEVVQWDLVQTRTSLGVHPMALLRGKLETAGVRRLARVWDGMRCSVAGLVIARQHPETAKGIVFLFLEDETGHCQGIISPEMWASVRPVLRSRALVLTGQIQRLRGWKTMVVESALPLEVLVVGEGEMAYFVR
jgi:error-prone DNA polymerase